MKATFSETITLNNGEQEVYIYVRGQLVHKRWKNTGRSVTFHTCPNGVRYNDDHSKTIK